MTRLPALLISLALLFAPFAGTASAQQVARDTLPRRAHGRRLPPPPASSRRFEEVRRFRVPEAHQGVVVDGRYFYAIDNTTIAKYDRRSGARVGEWKGDANGPIIHLNSCIVQGGRLICAHSNYPGVPMLSSIEEWSTSDLRHLASHSFGVYQGSLTWALRGKGDWWLAFANYGGVAGTPGHGPEWTTLVRMDDEWRPKEAYAFPVALVDRLAPNSSSGGNWGPDGLLYITGHDESEIYVLRLPEMGSVLEWVETIPAPLQGQAWSFDPDDPWTIWGIRRGTGEVVVARLRN
jgi:hypothetical protein